jgi:hypothetical protein
LWPLLLYSSHGNNFGLGNVFSVLLASSVFLKKIGSRMHSDPKFGQRGVLVILMTKKKGSGIAFWRVASQKHPGAYYLSHRNCPYSNMNLGEFWGLWPVSLWYKSFYGGTNKDTQT